MRCPKCNGVVVNDSDEPYCLQCGNRNLNGPVGIPDDVAQRREAGRRGGKARVTNLKAVKRKAIARKAAQVR